MKEVRTVKQDVGKIIKDDGKKALKRVKNGNAVGPNNILVLAKLFNMILDLEEMPKAWRRSGLVQLQRD